MRSGRALASLASLSEEEWLSEPSAPLRDECLQAYDGTALSFKPGKIHAEWQSGRERGFVEGEYGLSRRELSTHRRLATLGADYAALNDRAML